MARKYRLSRKAETNLVEIWKNIAIENVAAADKFYFQVIGKIEQAAEYPGIGALRQDIGDNVRLLVVGYYNIFYVTTVDGIVVTTIVHARRLPANWS